MVLKVSCNMKEYICLFYLLLIGQLSFSQKKDNPIYFHAGAYADVSAEFIYLHYLRMGFQKYYGKNISVQTSLKFGSRSNVEIYVPSDRDGVPINWINWHPDNPNGNPVIFSPNIEIPGENGISQYPIGDHSLFYLDLGLSAGYDIQLIGKLKAQFLGGFGIRYTDEHYVGEAGDALFEYQGVEYNLYYLIPVYQRGIDAHLNFEIGLLYPLSEKLKVKGGLVSDFNFGTYNIGVGNYYHLGTSLLIKL